ncbi:putative cutinase/acetylxylan esterase, alpha/Beta hydrolase [Plasmopara halstedii]
MAQECPNTVFVLGGYSQGASVADIAIGISTSLGLQGQTIESSSQLYGSKAGEYRNLGDPVCGNGFNTIAHMTYPTDGSVDKAASQAAALVQGGGYSLRGIIWKTSLLLLFSFECQSIRLTVFSCVRLIIHRCT